MLEYERKLGFDRTYKKMQDMTIGHVIICLLWCLVCYFGVYYVLFYLKGTIPDIYAWNDSVEVTKIWGITLHLTDLIYFVAGVIIMCYGSVRLMRITKDYHKAREQKNKLLIDGYYLKVRHPMYGTFVIMYIAIALSVHSLIGLIIVALMTIGQCVNAILEEKRDLIPNFQQQYLEYKKRVKGLILLRWQSGILVALTLITLIGFLPFFK